MTTKNATAAYLDTIEEHTGRTPSGRFDFIGGIARLAHNHRVIDELCAMARVADGVVGHPSDVAAAALLLAPSATAERRAELLEMAHAALVLCARLAAATQVPDSAFEEAARLLGGATACWGHLAEELPELRAEAELLRGLAVDGSVAAAKPAPAARGETMRELMTRLRPALDRLGLHSSGPVRDACGSVIRALWDSDTARSVDSSRVSAACFATLRLVDRHIDDLRGQMPAAPSEVLGAWRDKVMALRAVGDIIADDTMYPFDLAPDEGAMQALACLLPPSTTAKPWWMAE